VRVCWNKTRVSAGTKRACLLEKSARLLEHSVISSEKCRKFGQTFSKLSRKKNILKMKAVITLKRRS
jgi:hypothetical protein